MRGRSVLFNHNVEDFAGHIDDALDGFAVDVGRGVGVGAGGGHDGVLVGAGGNEEFGAAFAVDLHDDLLLGGDEAGGVVGGPGRGGGRAGAAEAGPELLGDVRGERGEQLEEREGVGAGDAPGFLPGVHEDHHLGDGGVEAQAFDVVA